MKKKVFIKTCKKIIEKNGVCSSIRCIDCPFSSLYNKSNCQKNGFSDSNSHNSQENPLLVNSCKKYIQENETLILGDFKSELSRLPKFNQRQDSLNDQRQDLLIVANRFGMYDAADFIRKTLEK